MNAANNLICHNSSRSESSILEAEILIPTKKTITNESI